MTNILVVPAVSSPSRALLGLTLLASLTSVLSPAAPAGAQEGPPGRWERVHERVAPPARGRGSMTYDEARDVLVLFGGLTNTGQLGDTWLFDGTWERAEPATSPSPRLGTAMAYDSVRHRVVLFGGHAGTQRLDETWSWDGTTWSRLSPPTAPSARSFATMTYDVARDEIVLFGGMPAGGGILADTWTWDGTTWTKRTPTVSPPYRDSASMVYDPARQEVVLFGGYGQGGSLGDTWTWDGSTWEQQTLTTAPPRRSSAGLAADPRHDSVVLFGGIDNVGYRNDTWIWNGTTWMQATPPVNPPSRASMGLGWHGGEKEIVLFGGSSANLDRNDTWTWDGSAWRSRDPAAPDAVHSAVASSGPDGTAVLFGGMTDAGMSAETWAWDGAWERVAAGSGPEARINASMVYDSIRDEVVLFGGMGVGGTELGDTWVWNGENWTERETTLSPPARHNHVMAYDSKNRQVVLFGGSNGGLGLVFSDTWTWNGVEWTLRTPGASPPALSAASMTYDIGRDNIVMFGGYDQNVQRTNDTWIWNGFNWQEAPTSLAPTARAAGQLTYDPNLGVPLLFGGNQGLGEHLRDVWAWDGTTWLELDVPGPPERWGGTLAYSSAAGASMLFGGNRNTYLDDTWVFRTLRRIGSDPVLITDRRTISGPFWFVYGVVVAEDGAGAAFEIDPSFENARSVAYGLYAIRAGDLGSESFFVGTGDTTAPEVIVDDDGSGVHQRIEQPGGVSGRTSGFTTTFDDLERGEYYFVIVNTSPNATQATIRLFGDSTVELVSASQGSKGGLARETDFEGPRNIQARAGWGPIKAHVGLIENGRLDATVEHRLFGIYQSLGADPNDVSYVGPDGVEKTGQTTYVFSGKPAGEYTFKVNQWRAANAGFGSAGYIALLMADVALPPFPA